MLITRKRLFDCSLIITTLLFVSLLITTMLHIPPAISGSVKLYDKPKTVVTINEPTIFPESITYNSKSKRFLISSFRHGAIYEVNPDGQTTQIVSDNRLCSVLGIRIDLSLDRLYATNSDLGACTKPTKEGVKKTAALAIYQLSNGQPIDYIDLSELLPNDAHLANGLTLDNKGNVYITDSFSPTIYKVDNKGNASVFINNKEFLGEGINLNGIVFHPDGYLLTVKKSTGELFKIPTDNPNGFTKVQSDTKLVGGDGVILGSNKELIVIANQALGVNNNSAYSLKSYDNWGSFTVTGRYKFGDVYPTTATIKDKKIFAVHSNINKLVAAPIGKKHTIKQSALIKEIGVLVADK